jgi:hypothetical protein
VESKVLMTITPIVFEAGDCIRPCIELRIRAVERSPKPRRLLMQWIRETDIHGRTILRSRWVPDLPEPAPERERRASTTSRRAVTTVTSGGR